MGAFLEKPKTEKVTDTGEGNGIRYGVSAMQGWRMEMEDAHVCSTELFLKDSSFFGVFDGHAGSKVAKHCSTNIINSIEKFYSKKEEDEVERLRCAIDRGFINLDSDMREADAWAKGQDRSGTTAIISIITPDHIVWGNCGDSRGILCRMEKVHFATSDHKPYNEPERLRIEKAGGTVMMQRVNGSLAVSRALGDFDYKRNSEREAIEQLVSPEPEITVCKRDPTTDCFLLLACDGIFDVMTNEEVVAFVHHQLFLKEDLSAVCSALIDKCLNKNSRDNMSVIIIVFPAAPTVSEEKVKEEEEKNISRMKTVEEEIKKLAEAADDPMLLEENYVFGELERRLGFDVFERKEEILTMIEMCRKEKFGNVPADYEGNSDSADAPKDFDLPSYQDEMEGAMSPLSSGEQNQPLESDTTTVESDSATNQTIM